MAAKQQTASSLTDAWKRLYHLADQIQELAPWQWMDEDQLFGVEFPGSEAVGFVSVMGTLGQHRAVTVYLGTEGLQGFWKAEGPESEDGDPTDIFHVPQLMASFEQKSQLERRDREQVRGLGLSYGGGRRWPLFRSHRPGYHPWFLEPAEVEMLSLALEQTLDVARRAREDASLLEVGEDPDIYLVRAPRRAERELVWEDRHASIPMEPINVVPAIDRTTFAALRRLERAGKELEVDCMAAPVRIGPPGTRPQWPHLLMAVDAESGLILGTEFLEAVQGLPALWSQIPARLLSILASSGMRPASIRVRSSLYRDLLRPILRELGMKVSMRPELPAIEAVKESFFEFLMRTGGPSGRSD